MARGGFVVARVEVADHDRLATLWINARAESGQSSEWAERAVREGRLTRALERDEVRVFIAEMAGEPVGYVSVVHNPLSGLGEDGAVWIDHLYVDPAMRRRGAAAALLGAVSAFADVVGAAQVVSCVPAGEREANRWLARLGFGGHLTARSISSAALHRRLAPEAAAEGVTRRSLSVRARARARKAS